MIKFIAMIVLGLSSFSATAQMTSCTLRYDMQGWSFIYQNYKGTGVVSCRNGQSVGVVIESRGAGATIGKSRIDKGRGVFSPVENINEIFGTYVFLDGHAGVTRSVAGVVMTKGMVSLALSGVGRGVDLGVSLGGFTIKPR